MKYVRNILKSCYRHYRILWDWENKRNNLHPKKLLNWLSGFVPTGRPLSIARILQWMEDSWPGNRANALIFSGLV